MVYFSYFIAAVWGSTASNTESKRVESAWLAYALGTTYESPVEKHCCRDFGCRTIGICNTFFSFQVSAAHSISSYRSSGFDSEADKAKVKKCNKTRNAIRVLVCIANKHRKSKKYKRKQKEVWASYVNMQRIVCWEPFIHICTSTLLFPVNTGSVAPDRRAGLKSS
jgi:hypothetical protein